MVAFARLGSVACQRLAPDVEGFHALALLRLIKPPLTDKAIVAKEKEVKRLRDRLGLSRWCRLYAGEMEIILLVVVPALQTLFLGRGENTAPTPAAVPTEG